MVTTQGEKHSDEMTQRALWESQGDGDVVHKGLDHWGDLARSGKGCGWAGKQLDKKRGLCVQGGGRESVGGNEAGFVQRALNATIKDSSLIL